MNSKLLEIACHLGTSLPMKWVFFIAYASTFTTVKKMLNSMFIGSPKGNYDRLLDCSTPKTGTLFFVPALDMLDDFSSD